MKFLQKPGTKPFIFGFLHAALLAFVLGSIPMFKAPYGYPQIICIKAPCPQAKFSLFQYPKAVEAAETRVRWQMERLNNEIDALQTENREN